MNNVLIIAAHADDETIGMGGTIAKHAHYGDNVRLITLTDGVGSRKEQDPNDVSTRQNSLKQAAQILGIKQYDSFTFPDNQMDTVALLSIVQPIEDIVYAYQPNIIYTHLPDDLNIDHQITHRAVMTACRAFPNSSVKRIFAFAVRSSTEWQTPTLIHSQANYYVDITGFEQTKRQALLAYKQELRDFPHSRSLKAIEAQQIETGACVGVAAAEKFYLVRAVN